MKLLYLITKLYQQCVISFLYFRDVTHDSDGSGCSDSNDTVDSDSNEPGAFYLHEEPVGSSDENQYLDVESDEEEHIPLIESVVLDSVSDYSLTDVQPLIVVAAALVVLVIETNISATAFNSLMTVLMVSVPSSTFENEMALCHKKSRFLDTALCRFIFYGIRSHER